MPLAGTLAARRYCANAACGASAPTARVESGWYTASGSRRSAAGLEPRASVVSNATTALASALAAASPLSASILRTWARYWLRSLADSASWRR